MNGTYRQCTNWQYDENAHFRLTDKFTAGKRDENVKDAFRRVCDGKAETILISGEPGIGRPCCQRPEGNRSGSETGFLLFSGIH